ESYRKAFSVGAPDETCPNTRTWKIKPPAQGTNAALVLRFPKPLDHALLQRMLWVTDGNGRKIAGQIAVSDEETRWCFTPDSAWKAGKYFLVANTALEDLAGNSIGRPFEVDMVRPTQRTLKAETVKVPFSIPPGDYRK